MTQDPRSRIQDPGSWMILDPGSWIQDPGSWIPDPGSKMLEPGYWIQDAGRSWNEVDKLVRSWYEVATKLVRSKCGHQQKLYTNDFNGTQSVRKCIQPIKTTRNHQKYDQHYGQGFHGKSPNHPFGEARDESKLKPAMKSNKALEGLPHFG